MQKAIQALQGVPSVPWLTDIDVHYDSLAQQWRRVGTMLGPPPLKAQGPTQPYLSAQASQLVAWRKGPRQYLRQEAGERNRRTLIFVFVAFRLHASNVSFTSAQRRTLDTWYRELDMSEAEALHRMYVYGFYLRKQVALDRRRYLQQLAENVRLQDVRDPRALFQAVRKAFPAAKGAKRAAFRPLPAVRDEEGQLVVTAEDRAERFRAFFGAQEAGFEATDEQYVQHMRAQPKLQDHTVFDIQVVPTLLELEGIKQSLHTRKAAGLDQIASELLQVHVPTTMRQFLPVCVKASLALREPCQFRGGELICLAKKAGAALQCTGFRSILISSVPGKVLHRALRTRLLEVLIRNRPTLQAGAVPREGIETIAIAAQSFQLLREGKKMPWALVFYDVQTAFYSVIRELIVPSTQTDEGLLRLLHALRLPPAALDELKQKLEALALLPSLKASPHLIGAVQDLYRGTWFKLSQSALLTITRRGTRPGDPAADAVFGLAMSALLHSIDHRLEHAQLLPTVPASQDPPPWATSPGPPKWGCPAWADDFVQPVDGASTADLLQRIQASVGIVSGCVSALGMRLTFDVEKTAALLPCWVNVQQPPIEQGEQEGHYIPVQDSHQGSPCATHRAGV